MTFRPFKPRPPGATKTIVAELFDEIGGVEKASLLLGRGLSRTYAYADPREDAQLSLDAARRLTVATGATAVAWALAFDAGGAFMPAWSGEESLHEALARAQDAFGAWSAAAMRKLPIGGALDAETVQDLDRLIAALIVVRRKAAP